MRSRPLLFLLLVSCAGTSGASGAGSSRAASSGESGAGASDSEWSSSGSRTCVLPDDTAPFPFLLFRSDNRSAYDLVTAERLELADRCRPGLAYDPAFDAAAFVEQLDALGCGGDAVASFTTWNVRFFRGVNGQPDVRGVVESRDAVHILTSTTVGGMPGGAEDESTFALVFPPTEKPILDCATVTDLGPYSGPMPP